MSKIIKKIKQIAGGAMILGLGALSLTSCDTSSPELEAKYNELIEEKNDIISDYEQKMQELQDKIDQANKEIEDIKNPVDVPVKESAIKLATDILETSSQLEEQEETTYKLRVDTETTISEYKTRLDALKETDSQAVEILNIEDSLNNLSKYSCYVNTVIALNNTINGQEYLQCYNLNKDNNKETNYNNQLLTYSYYDTKSNKLARKIIDLKSNRTYVYAENGNIYANNDGVYTENQTQQNFSNTFLNELIDSLEYQLSVYDVEFSTNLNCYKLSKDDFSKEIFCEQQIEYKYLDSSIARIRDIDRYYKTVDGKQQLIQTTENTSTFTTSTKEEFDENLLAAKEAIEITKQNQPLAIAKKEDSDYEMSM